MMPDPEDHRKAHQMAIKNFELALEDYENVTEEEDRILEFTLPVFEPGEEEGDPPVQVGTETYETYLPSTTQVALYAGAVASDDMDVQFGGVFRFMRNCFLPETHADITARMADRRDPVGLSVMQDVLKWIIEETTANPSTGSATSSSSRQPTGNASKATPAPRKGQTRSRSTRAASST